MKKTLFYMCCILILGSLSFSGCASRSSSKRVDERPGNSVDKTFGEGGAMEKGDRSTDKDNY